MNGNLLLLLTLLSWVALATLILPNRNIKGEYMVGLSMFIFVLLAAYGLLSLWLTIRINASGSFDWLSPVRSTRNLLVGAGWFCMMVGVAFCVLGGPGSAASKPGFVGMLERVFSYGVLWMPVLMLVPYAILSNPAWKSAVSPLAYTLPLAVGTFIGAALLFAPSIISSIQTRNSARELRDYEFQKEMEALQREKEVRKMIVFTLAGKNERLREAAVAQIKQTPQWEDSLCVLLKPNHLAESYWFYSFMANNELENPDRFLKPIQDHLAILAPAIHEALSHPDQDNNEYYYADLETICKVLNLHLGAHRATLKPAMVNLLNAVETPIPPGQNAPAYMLSLQEKYRETLKKWLKE